MVLAQDSGRDSAEKQQGRENSPSGLADALSSDAL